VFACVWNPFEHSAAGTSDGHEFIANSAECEETTHKFGWEGGVEWWM
jgi:hypothetical protein